MGTASYCSTMTGTVIRRSRSRTRLRTSTGRIGPETMARRIAIETQPDWPIEDFRIERAEAEALLERPNSKEAASAFIEDREPGFEG